MARCQNDLQSGMKKERGERTRRAEVPRIALDFHRRFHDTRLSLLVDVGLDGN